MFKKSSGTNRKNKDMSSAGKSDGTIPRLSKSMRMNAMSNNTQPSAEKLSGMSGRATQSVKSQAKQMVVGAKPTTTGTAANSGSVMQQKFTQANSETADLSAKEESLLNDAKQHEQLCIEKYKEFTSKAENADLCQLFNEIKSQEQNHLKTINQILKKGVYSGASNGSQGSGMTGTNMQKEPQRSNDAKSYQGDFKRDKYLCQDALTLEKYVSGVYDSAIFELKDNRNREALNYIQHQEQQHGEWIYNFMACNGMYETQG